ADAVIPVNGIATPPAPGAAPNQTVSSPALQPSAAGSSSCSLRLEHVNFKGDGGLPSVYARFNDPPCSAVPGTLTVSSSVDQLHWTQTRQVHTDDVPLDNVASPCLPGARWYKGSYVTDDQGLKVSTPVYQFTC